MDRNRDRRLVQFWQLTHFAAYRLIDFALATKVTTDMAVVNPIARQIVTSRLPDPTIVATEVRRAETAPHQGFKRGTTTDVDRAVQLS